MTPDRNTSAVNRANREFGPLLGRMELTAISPCVGDEIHAWLVELVFRCELNSGLAVLFEQVMLGDVAALLGGRVAVLCILPASLEGFLHPLHEVLRVQNIGKYILDGEYADAHLFGLQDRAENVEERSYVAD